MRPSAALLALLVAATLPAAPPPAAATEPLASHRAGYRLTLDSAQSASDVQGATGIMVYEAIDRCEGWTVQQRFVLTVTSRSGSSYEMASDYVTWEAKDGSRLRFRLRQTTDGAIAQSIQGEARREPGRAGVIRYTEPAEDEVELAADVLFPMAHTRAVLDAAAAGRRIFAAPVFDGTVTEGPQDTNAAITQRLEPGTGGTRWAPLAALPSFRMRIAFFEAGSQTGQPDYEVAMRYWQNGVADDLRMDFGEFIVAGSLSELEMLPDQCN